MKLVNLTRIWRAAAVALLTGQWVKKPQRDIAQEHVHHSVLAYQSDAELLSTFAAWADGIPSSGLWRRLGYLGSWMEAIV